MTSQIMTALAGNVAIGLVILFLVGVFAAVTWRSLNRTFIFARLMFGSRTEADEDQEFEVEMGTGPGPRSQISSTEAASAF
ncbi:hypothetical protein F4677DRAFT_406368 [Hypoxylon crocopeplum]|nr:hypothetical protein F4677DRAFT_406368 [Hypoxylon crocopeplum]